MPAVTTHTLSHAGATLYYEVRGSGPVLLMIPGGPADAGVFDNLATLLADRYTVVTYDPRGNSRSVLDDPEEEQRIEVHADDALRLLDAVGATRAYVFGSSGGGVVGLELVSRRPERVAMLVTHEPPVINVLPDAARWRRFFADLQSTYTTEGVGPAMQMFAEGTGMGNRPQPDPSELPPDVRETMARTMRNVPFFLERVVGTVAGYVPDLDALGAQAGRIVVAGGAKSAGQMPYEAATALARLLGTAVVEFPGDHGGFGTHPGPFADAIHQVLSRE